MTFFNANSFLSGTATVLVVLAFGYAGDALLSVSSKDSQSERAKFEAPVKISPAASPAHVKRIAGLALHI